MMPYSVEIEQSVLGVWILGEYRYYIPKLSETDFYDNMCKETYKALMQMYTDDKTIDVITVSDLLKHDYNYVSGLTSVPASTENMKHYVEQLKDYTARRKAIAAAQDIINKASDMTATEIRNMALERFDFDGIENESPTDINSIMDMVMDEIQAKANSEKKEKYFTGFHAWDKFTAGLHNGEMTIIAARPGIGKTAISIHLMMNLAKKGIKSLFVSREMKNVQIGLRMLANQAKLDSQQLRLGEIGEKDEQIIAREQAIIKSWPIHINDKISTIQELVNYCREHRAKNGLDVLFVDYIGLIRTLKKCNNREQEVADISRQFKELSLDLDIPVIVLSQLNRESVTSKEPSLHHLRESGSIEQDADNVVFLHVPADTDETAEWFDIKIIIAKQRNGAIGSFNLRWYRRCLRFENIYYK